VCLVKITFILNLFVGMTLQAWHTCIWEFLPFFSADPLKLSQVGWGALLHSYIFLGFSRSLDRVQVRALAWTLKDIQRLVPKPLLCCLGCVLRVVVLLEGEPSPQSEDLSALKQNLVSLDAFFCKLQAGCHVPFTEESLLSGPLYHKGLIWWSAAEMVVLLEGSPISTEKL
jgi:hypothetical protein